MRTEQVNVYTYEELSPKAQEKARDWYRQVSSGDTYWSDGVLEDIEKIAKCFGWTTSHSKIFWSGFGCQGSGLSFLGNWKSSDVNLEGLKEFFNEDTLPAFESNYGQNFTSVKLGLEMFYRRLLSVEENPVVEAEMHRHNTNYSHEGTVSAVLDSGPLEEPISDSPVSVAQELSRLEKWLTQASRKFMTWAYKRLEEAYDSWNSDESVADNIIANEYEFSESGSRWHSAQ